MDIGSAQQIGSEPERQPVVIPKLSKLDLIVFTFNLIHGAAGYRITSIEDTMKTALAKAAGTSYVSSDNLVTDNPVVGHKGSLSRDSVEVEPRSRNFTPQIQIFREYYLCLTPSPTVILLSNLSHSTLTLTLTPIGRARI